MGYYKSVKCCEYQAQKSWIELWKILPAYNPFVPDDNYCCNIAVFYKKQFIAKVIVKADVSLKTHVSILRIPKRSICVLTSTKVHRQQQCLYHIAFWKKAV